MHSEKGEEPPCDTCRPKFIEENSDAVRIFYLVRSQFIMGFDGPIDISHEAIHRAMELYEVEDKQRCFEKILIMSGEWMKRMKDE